MLKTFLHFKLIGFFELKQLHPFVTLYRIIKIKPSLDLVTISFKSKTQIKAGHDASVKNFAKSFLPLIILSFIKVSLFFCCVFVYLKSTQKLLQLKFPVISSCTLFAHYARCINRSGFLIPELLLNSKLLHQHNSHQPISFTTLKGCN